MQPPFRSAAVLGAGVMGAQIAAHLANAGLMVDLLDVAADDGPRNGVVETLFARTRKLSPPPFFVPELAAQIRLGNFTDDWARLAEVDWVIEAVIERLDVKRQLTERLDGHIRDDAVISTNTSGLQIAAIAQGRSASFRRRFLGTHFFNPPRYLHLLELVPTADTDPTVLGRIRDFGRVHLGKGVVVAKDTPDFIANRIGVYAILRAIRFADEQGLSVPQVDAWTGPGIGRPKSATFRTCDVVGLDTLLHVAEHLHAAVTDDESRAALEPPAVLRDLVARGHLGAKTGQGFYRKEKGALSAWDAAAGDYRPVEGAAAATLPRGDLATRLRALWGDDGAAGRFFRTTTLDLLGYAARRVPEITESPADLDRALRWGFGWQLGPFETWDTLGFETVLAALHREATPLPAWITELARREAPAVYREAGGERLVFVPKRLAHAPDPRPADEISVAATLRVAERLLDQDEHSRLVDLGDGVAGFVFRSKANTLTLGVVEALWEAIARIEREPFAGMVIGHDGDDFSPGANLVEMVTAARAARFDDIDAMVARFQALADRLRRAAKPVLIAARGRVLGGACELTMACPHAVLAADSYLGLVEAKAGLIPAGGGTMRMGAWAAARAGGGDLARLLPFVERAHRTLASGAVAGSAFEAQRLGYADPRATVVRHRDRLLFVAKREVLRLADEGWLPPLAPARIAVAGEAGRQHLESALPSAAASGDPHDLVVARAVARVLTGGEVAAGSEVSPQHLLDLERETFVTLLRSTATQHRIAALVGR